MDVFKEILNFSLVDFADVFLVALLLYSSYRLLRGTVAINIFIGIIIGIIFHFSTDVLRTIGMSGTLPIFFATYGVPLISIFFLLGILIHTEDG